MSEVKELTFGQEAVGITFNPSALESVNRIKDSSAALIDILHEYREAATDGEVKAQLTLAIRRIQEGQMWGVKGVTWKTKKV